MSIKTKSTPKSPTPSSAKRAHVVGCADDPMSVVMMDSNGVSENKGPISEWVDALHHYRVKKKIKNHADGLANTIATIFANWAKTGKRDWIKSIFVIPGKSDEINSSVTVLISVNSANAENSWECNRFALLLSGHAERAIETCIVEEDVEPQTGYIYSFQRANA